jgi:hypothetical protein
MKVEGGLFGKNKETGGRGGGKKNKLEGVHMIKYIIYMYGNVIRKSIILYN